MDGVEVERHIPQNPLDHPRPLAILDLVRREYLPTPDDLFPNNDEEYPRGQPETLATTARSDDLAHESGVLSTQCLVDVAEDLRNELRRCQEIDIAQDRNGPCQ